PKKVVIIGGGPAGLEAARVAAIQGHEVELFERNEVLGGQLHLWALSPSMSELQKTIEWEQNQLKKLKVKINLNSLMTVEDIKSLKFDELIIATGSNPQLKQFMSVDSFNMDIATPHDVIWNKKGVSAKKVIIWDQEGGLAGSQAALSAAELLLNKGAEV